MSGLGDMGQIIQMIIFFLIGIVNSFLPLIFIFIPIALVLGAIAMMTKSKWLDFLRRLI